MTKLTDDSPSTQHGPAIDEPGFATAVQQPDARKNYIGIVSDTTEEERMADGAARAQSHVVGYLVGRLAAALGRPRKGAPGYTAAP